MNGRPPNQERDEQHISGQEARQGEIILRTRAQRIIFILGLAGFVLLAMVIAVG